MNTARTERLSHMARSTTPNTAAASFPPSPAADGSSGGLSAAACCWWRGGDGDGAPLPLRAAPPPLPATGASWASRAHAAHQANPTSAKTWKMLRQPHETSRSGHSTAALMVPHCAPTWSTAMERLRVPLVSQPPRKW